MPAMSAPICSADAHLEYEVAARRLLKWFDSKQSKSFGEHCSAKREIAALPVPTLAFVADLPQYRRIATGFHIRLSK
jgi:hypothetical protein